jgi:hypothetical protein
LEGLNFGKIIAHVAYLEAIMILFAFVAFKEFKLYQMDVKNVFLNVSFRKRSMLDNPQVFRTLSIQIEYKHSKALHGVKQASRAWYARLKTILLDHG